MPEKTVQEKAQTIWDGWGKNERAMVSFGMFNHTEMEAAEAEGYNGKDLAVALMDITKENGKMVV